MTDINAAYSDLVAHYPDVYSISVLRPLASAGAAETLALGFGSESVVWTPSTCSASLDSAPPVNSLSLIHI